VKRTPFPQRRAKSGHHLTLNCAPATAALLRRIAESTRASLSTLIATGFSRYLADQIPDDLEAPCGRLVSIGIHINADTARLARAKLAANHRTMPWLLIKSP